MSRRTHTKSRSGCTRCKRRHIRCDESRPICLNCSIANLDCEYAASHLHTAKVGMSTTSDFDHITAKSPSLPPTAFTTMQDSPSGQSSAVLASNSSVYGADPGLNIDHIELLHHFCTVTYKTMSPQRDHQDTWQVCSCVIVLNTERSRGFSSPILDVATYILVLCVLRNLFLCSDAVPYGLALSLVLECCFSCF